MKIITILSAVLLLSGCSSVNRVSEIENHSLLIGQSKKSDIVAQIGLPQKVSKSNNLEHWYYSGSEQLRHIFSIHSLATLDIYNAIYLDSDKKEFSPVLVCVFDEKGVLKALYKTNIKKEHKR